MDNTADTALCLLLGLALIVFWTNERYKRLALTVVVLSALAVIARKLIIFPL